MALPTFRDIDYFDIPKVLRLAGSTRRYVDTGDYEKVIKEMEVILNLATKHVRCDPHDISEFIIRAQLAQAADVTAPAFTVLDPVDNATAVAVNKQPGVTFGEAIVFGGAGSFSLRKTAGDVLVYLWSVGTSQGSGLGQCEIVPTNKVLLHPDVALTAATQYYITWTAGAVRDLAGNNCVAQASTTVWSFTTA